MARTVQITFDAADPRGLGAFWCVALGYVEQPPPDGFVDWASAMAAWGMSPDRYNAFYAVVDPDGVGPRIFIQQVPEPKTAKNRMHIDVGVEGEGAERVRNVREHAERLVALGASLLQEMDENGEFWIVLQDPEGNEFCVQ
ncbi:glyoxalase/bleomycin resistance/dioxygenase family protein [Oerskovia turbata]|uniref:Glyoxalase/bleomycin resistance/dioxygenase family protein n=1 Tax=Oerskovia turbata TaxID=1713 RepID=A0A4Q1KQ54_9CELL|nr:VOC family protein [Oerskovia turbata]RXR22059.1 glyoxalase/bleomycin resistance/dioxygenase family protein [Oerskovia turbata]RXR31982.1 glyoxalase/bleomycin resistance/dioxygenase family protein [Oerskovia turbata]TGJ96905.1 glyoxalase/bleomycin resistance/dioxygenase family protein [Actinotalea fermentans ATCC 43279 = JCM 9966 = DSM 3133]